MLSSGIRGRFCSTIKGLRGSTGGLILPKAGRSLYQDTKYVRRSFWCSYGRRSRYAARMPFQIFCLDVTLMDGRLFSFLKDCLEVIIHEY